MPVSGLSWGSGALLALTLGSVPTPEGLPLPLIGMDENLGQQDGALVGFWDDDDQPLCKYPVCKKKKN